MSEGGRKTDGYHWDDVANTAGHLMLSTQTDLQEIHYPLSLPWDLCMCLCVCMMGPFVDMNSWERKNCLVIPSALPTCHYVCSKCF